MGGWDPPQQSPHVVYNTHSAACRTSDTMQWWNLDGFWGTVCWTSYTRGVLLFPTTSMTQAPHPPTLTSDLLLLSKNIYIQSAAGLKMGPVNRDPEKSHAAEKDNINNSHKCYCSPGMSNTIF